MFTLDYANTSLNYILHITKITLRYYSTLIHYNYQLIHQPLCTTFVKSETSLIREVTANFDAIMLNFLVLSCRVLRFLVIDLSQGTQKRQGNNGFSSIKQKAEQEITLI